MTTTEMQVHVDCPGCEAKIRKALEKLKGVDIVEIDMAMQKVTVTGWADQKKVLKTVRKTGRRAEIWQFPYSPDLRNHNYNNNNAPSSTYFAPQPSASSSSSYNYYKHGYTHNYSHGSSSSSSNYAHYPLHSSSIFGHQTGAAFSDENPNACSII